MQQGSDGRDSDGIGSQGIIEEKEREVAGAAAQPFGSADGKDTDGAGSGGILDEAGEQAGQPTAELAGFAADGSDTDGAGSAGILAEKEAEAPALDPDEQQR